MERETMKNKIDVENGQAEVGEKNISLTEKIKQARDKEMARLKDENEKSEKAKQINDSLLAERFSKLKSALNELKHTYSQNKDICVNVHEFSAFLSFGSSSDGTQGEMFIEPDGSGEGFSISGSILGHNSIKLDSVEDVICYIAELIGKYLAQRDWHQRT
jgi:hypothetical protein